MGKNWDVKCDMFLSVLVLLFYVSMFCLGSTLSKCTLDDIGKYSHRDLEWYQEMAKKYPINDEVK